MLQRRSPRRARSARPSVICELDAERINLLTDGAIYTANGVLAGVGMKAVELPQCNAAFVVRGLNLISFELSKFFPRLSGFENLIAVAADTHPKVREWALEGTADWEVLIAGFSEQGLEMHFYKSSTNDGLRRIDGDFFVAGRGGTCELRRVPARHSGNGSNAAR
jgi:hypothetical protein